MKEKFKKTILVDLDGVLNTYSGEYDENLKNGAKEFLQKLSADYKVNIFYHTKPVINFKMAG